MLHGQSISLSRGGCKGQGGGKRHALAVVVPDQRWKRWVPQLRAHLPHRRGAQQDWTLL